MTVDGKRRQNTARPARISDSHLYSQGDMTLAPAVLTAARECFSEGPKGVRRWMQRNRPYICPFDRLVPFVPSGATVLDVGCGDGLFLGILVRLGIKINAIGFDASAPAIATATAMAQRISADDQLRFLHVDAREEWPAGEFDVVSMIDVLHHVPPYAQQKVIELAASRVRPGGIFLYKDIRGGTLGLMNRLHDLVVAREFIHYVRADTVEGWAADRRLKLFASDDIRLLWYPHVLRVFRRE